MKALKEISRLITELSHNEINVLIDILIDQQRKLSKECTDAIRKELEIHQGISISN